MAKPGKTVTAPKRSPKEESVEFPPLPFSLDMLVKIPTLTGVWEGRMSELLEVDVDNPSPKLAEASSLTALFAFTRAYMRERVLKHQDMLKVVESRFKKRLIENPPNDANNDPIRVTKEVAQAWLLVDQTYQQALDQVRQAERLYEIIDQMMWELKTWHKDLQILASKRFEETGVERSTPPSVDTGRKASGRASKDYDLAETLRED